ncbi:MAG: hypothetical protein J6T04_02235 [Bacteroidales bacterium]|nr:hypothetical protein [Bacteroidales bacterium]
MKFIYKRIITIAIILVFLTACTSKEHKDNILEIANNSSVLTKLSTLYYAGDDPESLARMLNLKEIKESDLNSIANNRQKQINTLFNYYAYNYYLNDKASFIRMRSEFDPEWGFFKSIRYWRYIHPASFWILTVIGWIISIYIIILLWRKD